MLHARLRAAAGRDRIPTDGLIAHYTMDAISGGTIFDEAGNYDASIAGGVTQVAGIIGQATDYPSGDGDSFNTGLTNWAPAALTVSQWVKFGSISTASADYRAIHSSRGASNTNGIFTYQASAADSATGNAALRPHVSTSSGLASFDTAFTPSSGVWYHVIIMYDGVLRAFIDGVEDANSDAGGAITGTSDSLLFGDCRMEGGLHGQLDAVRIYDRALTASERAALYAEGA